MPGTVRSPFIVYAAAVAAIAVCTAIRMALDPVLGDTGPFALYLFAIVFVGFFGNVSAGLFTVLLAIAAGTYFFVPPRMSFAVAGPTEQIRVALFAVAGIIAALLIDRLHRIRMGLKEAVRAAEEQRTAVQQQRAKLQELIDSIPGVVWESWGEPASGHQRITFISDYAEKLLGYSVRDWLAKPNFWLELLPEKDRPEAARIATSRFTAGESGENEFRLIGKDGRHRWVLTRSSVIKDAAGRPVGMRGVSFDITERKEMERRLKLLADISASGISGLSFQQLASDIARRTTRILGECCIVRVLEDGVLRTVAIDHQSSEALPLIAAIADDPQLLEQIPIYGEVMSKPRTIVVNEVPQASFDRLTHAGLEPVLAKFKPTAVLVCPMIGHGRLFGTMALWRASGHPYRETDVKLAEAIAARAALALENARLFESVQREAHDAERARASAEEASRIKDEFLATLSHELRTPLNAILGWGHMLLDPTLAEERRHQAIETIVRNAQSQEQLISDILDVQRIMAGKLRLNLRSVDLGDIVRAAAETVQPSAEAKQIRLQLLRDLDVTPIRGDADRLQQVVWNLMSNAIKFTPRGGRVQVRLSRTDAYCELVVEDNGPGIPAEFLPFVFDRFRQADSSTTRTHKGLGLGLSIVRSLVEMHGGSIQAGNVDEAGRTGAVFTIRLPRQVARISAVAGDSPESTADDLIEAAQWLADAPALDGIRVLVVEDDTDARELVAAILERCGAEVLTSTSAAEAMTSLLKWSPDVIVSDIEMPGEDGYSFIRRVRELNGEQSRIPAAALTAYASTADRMKVLNAGFNIHIAKPVEPAELAVVVANLAGRRVEQPETRR